MAVVLTLLLAGFLLLALEVVLPGMIAGLTGGACLVAGVVLAYSRLGTSAGHVTLILTGSSLIAGFIVWLRFFPGSRLGRKFVSQRIIEDRGPVHSRLLHRTGQTLTTLRPCGTAVIDGHRVDVLSEGALIPPGTRVRVVEVEGLRVVVRPESEATPARAPALEPVLSNRSDSSPIHPSQSHP